ncbi:hypothetical protein SASPL_116959 [Salvia splendens]|uniref:Uncharacterized protein n=1 Tax=Salvia splendens TaxID=180675 RepID=A0A8X8ZX67_SALSN|nr:extensin-like [Salvia splendens]KAG6420432.1 hypothetical protein SASPL_116959 [Salvia splendens]
MCYVGKATKIFVFIVAILGLVLGFTLLRHHGIRKRCNSDPCADTDPNLFRPSGSNRLNPPPQSQSSDSTVPDSPPPPSDNPSPSAPDWSPPPPTLSLSPSVPDLSPPDNLSPSVPELSSPPPPAVISATPPPEFSRPIPVPVAPGPLNNS